MWIDAVKNKPFLNENDQWEAEQGRSERVVIWDELDGTPRFAVYVYSIDRWFIEGCTGAKYDRIKYFAYIDNPYK